MSCSKAGVSLDLKALFRYYRRTINGVQDSSGVANMDIQDIARNTFTISALLLTATIVILSYSWKRLRTLIRTMPEGKRRVQLFNLRSISDPNEADKYAYIALQFLSCVFLIISFAGALTAVFQMSGVMVGDTGGLYAAENFRFAVVAMRVAAFCLFIGIFSSAVAYLEDLVALYTGEPSVAMTKLKKLPKRALKDKAWSYTSVGLLCGFSIVLLLIELFVPFNQWAKMVIALAVGIALLVGAHFSYRLYVQIRSRRVPTPGEPDDSAPE